MNIGAYVTSTYGRKRTEAAAGLQAILEAKHGLTMLVAPEFTNIKKETAESLSAIDPKVLLIPGTRVMVLGEKIVNRAYLVYGGKAFYAYDKKTFCLRDGYSEVDHLEGGFPSGASLHRGERNGIFTFKNTRCGIEICNDHTRGYMTNNTAHPVLAHEHNHNLDYQVVLSCGAQFINTNGMVVKPDGICLMVDGDERPFSLALLGDSTVLHPTRRIPVPAAGPKDYLDI